MIAGIQRQHGQPKGLFVLNSPDTREVMIAVWTRGRVVCAMRGPAGVIMNHGLVVPVRDVKRSIGSDARVDGTEPEIRTGQELGIFAALLLLRYISRILRINDVVMDEAHCRFLEEMHVVPAFRPHATVIDAGTGGGREHTDRKS